MRLLKKFLGDRSGNIAVISSIVGLPLVLGVMLTLDIQTSRMEVGNIQDALDSAALSAVMKGSLTPAQREAHAVKAFNENYNGNIDLEVSAQSKGNRVKVFANGQFETSAGSMAGLKDINVAKGATAELIAETVTCLLILDPNGKKAMTFGGDSVFDSPNCAVQVNSRHRQGLWGGSNIRPQAADFCVTGGYYGRFGKHVKTDCRPIPDPYKERIIPPAGPCEKIPGITLHTPIEAGSFERVPVMVQNKTSEHTVLNPGNYCNGMKLNGKVIFTPGVYHMSDGALVLGKTADVVADNVTFILRGEGARLHMQEGAQAQINATRKGELGGIAFYQIPNPKKTYPEETTIVRSGGKLNVNGVFYFPSHYIHLTGNASLGAKAKATSFIAYRMYINADVKTRIEVDHVAAGLPPLEPRTDEGARLISDGQ